MLAMIDNYDSFTYNLVQAFGEMGADIQVFRNDKTTVADLEALKPDRIVVSPGPCSPTEAGISVEVIKHFTGRVPILGVCLGHQSIGHAFGAEVTRAPRLMHGKTSEVKHDGKGLLADMPNPFVATRYHSLTVREESLPDCLIPTCHSVDQNELMGLRHRDHPVEGVQFHPESFLTPEGCLLLKNFLTIGCPA